MQWNFLIYLFQKIGGLKGLLKGCSVTKSSIPPLQPISNQKEGEKWGMDVCSECMLRKWLSLFLSEFQ